MPSMFSCFRDICRGKKKDKSKTDKVTAQSVAATGQQNGTASKPATNGTNGHAAHEPVAEKTKSESTAAQEVPTTSVTTSTSDNQQAQPTSVVNESSADSNELPKEPPKQLPYSDPESDFMKQFAELHKSGKADTAIVDALVAEFGPGTTQHLITLIAPANSQPPFVTEIKLGSPPEAPGATHLVGEFRQKRESKAIVSRKVCEHLRKKLGIPTGKEAKQQNGPKSAEIPSQESVIADNQTQEAAVSESNEAPHLNGSSTEEPAAEPKSIESTASNGPLSKDGFADLINRYKSISTTNKLEVLDKLLSTNPQQLRVESAKSGDKCRIVLSNGCVFVANGALREKPKETVAKMLCAYLAEKAKPSPKSAGGKTGNPARAQSVNLDKLVAIYKLLESQKLPPVDLIQRMKDKCPQDFKLNAHQTGAGHDPVHFTEIVFAPTDLHFKCAAKTKAESKKLASKEAVDYLQSCAKSTAKATVP